MINLFVRALILYTLLVVVMRIMGKRQLGELQPFELVISISIAELASIPLEDVSVPIVKGFIPIFSLVIAHTLLTYFQTHNYRAGEVICGSPIVLINKGKICQENMQKAHISIDDLMETLRHNGYLDFHYLEYAIIENDGNISLFPCSDFAESNLPIPLIIEGKLVTENEKKHAEEYTTLLQTLKKQSLKPKDIYYAYIDPHKKLRIIEKETGDDKK